MQLILQNSFSTDIKALQMMQVMIELKDPFQ